MGLDTSHGYWHGAYSAFMRWRVKLSEVAGYGVNIYMPPDYSAAVDAAHEKGDPLAKLLWHSDCDGEIPWEDCSPLADALEKLLPALEKAGEAGGHIGNYADKTKLFISGLRDAAALEESVEFH